MKASYRPVAFMLGSGGELVERGETGVMDHVEGPQVRRGALDGPQPGRASEPRHGLWKTTARWVRRWLVAWERDLGAAGPGPLNWAWKWTLCATAGGCVWR